MISFIVDCFDPWENVYALLKAINESEIDDDYEIILMSSLLLDTQQEVAERFGNELFNNNFRLINNDSMSIISARCRAQELSNGEFFFYLSPLVIPKIDTIKILFNTIKKSKSINFVSSSLVFRYDKFSDERILAHGFGVSPFHKLMPILMTEYSNINISIKSYPVHIPNPYCFCTNIPFYNYYDCQGTFWQRHILACKWKYLDGIKGISIGIAASRLYLESFPTYYKQLTDVNTVDMDTDCEEIAKSTMNGLQLTPYADFRFKTTSSSVAPQESNSVSHIFWGLLYWESPEYVAAACRKLNTEALRVLAQVCLWKIANISEDSVKKSICELRNSTTPKDTETLKAINDWLSMHKFFYEKIYLKDFKLSLKNFLFSKNIFISLKNYLYLITSGLLGMKRIG